MRAIRVAKHGGPEELQLQEVAKPKPAAGEVLVRVRAAGVNYADIYFRSGALTWPIPFPFTPGLEGAGEVEAVGEGVTDIKRGDRVAYKWSLGSYAEYDVVKAEEVAPLPDGVRTISAGALANYTATSDELLRRARDVFGGLRDGWLKLRIDRTFPLAQAAEAHRLLESRQTAGKLILNC